MRMRRTAAAALGLGLAGAAVGLTTPAATAAAPASTGAPFTFAVIGDIPYGDAQIARFPAVVDQINADPAVRFVDHLGDIKSGSSTCDTPYFTWVRSQFDRFEDPLVYTPGDNEWTDCHRPNNGSYDPYERLATVRDLFFPQAGRTLGRQSVGVQSQVADGFVENVSYTRAGVAFAVPHVVGSNNGLAPWTGNTAPTAFQQQEVTARTQAAVDLLDATFAQATADGDRAVAVLLQADMFDPTVPNPSIADYSSFTPIVRSLAAHAAAFDGPVYLFNGDSHVFNDDQPLATGSHWLDFYGVTTPADNLTRVTVDGSTGVDNYLRVRVDNHDPAVLSWTRVPFTS